MVYIALIALILGIISGQFIFSAQYHGLLGTIADYLLYLLMFSVGISVGMNETIIQKIRNYNLSILLIPIGVTIGYYRLRIRRICLRPYLRYAGSRQPFHRRRYGLVQFVRRNAGSSFLRSNRHDCFFEQPDARIHRLFNDTAARKIPEHLLRHRRRRSDERRYDAAHADKIQRRGIHHHIRHKWRTVFRRCADFNKSVLFRSLTQKGYLS